MAVRKITSLAGTAGSLPSLAGRAWLASAVLHGSLAAAIVVRTAPAPAPPAPIAELQTPAPEVLSLPEPPPPPSPEVPVVPPPARDVPLPPKDAPRQSAARPAPAHTAAAAVSAPAAPTGEVGPVVSAEAAPPTFVMALPGGGAQGSTAAQTAAPARAPDVLDERGVSVRAEVTYGPAPEYPAQARAAEIEVDVPVEIVVNAAGEVVDARVTRRVGYGLEASATEAIRRYRFRPAQRDGRAVSVRMLWTMQYRLR